MELGVLEYFTSCSTFATKSLVVSSRSEEVARLNMQSFSHYIVVLG